MPHRVHEYQSRSGGVFVTSQGGMREVGGGFALEGEEAWMSWDDGRIERLKKLWSDGLSASQIAAELGGVTRNAVIGKVHRLGLSGRAKSKPATVARPRVKTTVKQARIPVATTRGNLAVIEMVETEVEVIRKPAEVLMIPLSRRISIMELREGLCKWPMGDPLDGGFAYCGADSGMGKVYCDAHCRIAYQPQNDRRRSG